jgi:hypothetical protein
LAKRRKICNLNLQNKHLATGRPTSAGNYRLAANAFAQIADNLASQNVENLTRIWVRAYSHFYGDPNVHIASKRLAVSGQKNSEGAGWRIEAQE